MRARRLLKAPCPALVRVAALLAIITSPAAAQTKEVRLLTIEGVIGPVTARYLERELSAAEDTSQLVVIRLDTPGGLESSMREMTQAIVGSPVPVAVFVAPSGARAASAGMFITMAAGVAAMAPGTNIGAAHPVALGGGQDSGDSAVGEKVVQDAAALARSLAEQRGRNAEWAEEAVFESVSITAAEALDRGVIDLLVPDLDSLLEQLDGRRVPAAGGEQTLRLRGAAIEERPMTLPERVLQAIIDPNVAYVLFTLALIGIAAELYNPGLYFPGIFGAISLVLSLVAFGSLPVSWAGLALLGLGVALVVAELANPGFGVLGLGGVAAFVLGSLLLYQPLGPVSPAAPRVAVSPWLVVVMASAFAAFFLLVVRALLRVRKRQVATGIDALIGRTAIATSDLDPGGVIDLEGESWSAVAEGPPIHRGEPVEVIGGEGVRLKVTRPDHPPADSRGAP